MTERLKRTKLGNLAAMLCLLVPSVAVGQPTPDSDATPTPSESAGAMGGDWNLNYGDRPKAPAMAPAGPREIATVKVRYLVDKTGKPRRCEVVESSGHENIDKRSCDIIERRFRFEPKVENGKRVSEWRTQTIRYQIEE